MGTADYGTELHFSKAALEALYARYNRKECVHPDPLEFVYRYEEPADREIVGLVASSLAYGRVAQILASVSTVLGRMGPSPSRFLWGASPGGLKRRFKDFKHRFTTGEELAVLLYGASRILAEYGSLEACFLTHLDAADPTIVSGLSGFVAQLDAGRELFGSMLLPSPGGGSACKRLNLFLRWMVREDAVDPGVWSDVPRSKLIVPLDTHMHRIGLQMGLTGRKQADLKAALEITARFRSLVPEDPVRYDFALTRLGILRGKEDR